MTGLVDFATESLGYSFNDVNLLVRAVTHRSAATGKAAQSGGNERLEFLGDRVLGLIVAEMLYKAFPKEREGALAKRFVALVRKEALAEVAEEIGLGEHMVLAKGEEDGGGRTNPALLSDCMEAVIAALYLDGGMEPVRAFIERFWTARLSKVESPPQDAKTQLQEWLQARGRPLPQYDTVSSEGPAHSPAFTVAVRIDGGISVDATAGSKRQAAQLAAESMLKKLTS